MAMPKRPPADHDPPTRKSRRVPTSTPSQAKSSRERTSTRKATLPPPNQAKSSGVRTSTRKAALPPPNQAKSSGVRTSPRKAAPPPPNQAKSSGVRTSTGQATSSRPTRSISARGKSSILPTPTETPAETPSITKSGSHDASDAGNSHGSSKTLNDEEVALEALKFVTTAAAAEQSSLDVSFSKVKYKDIAPKVGLEPSLRGNDIPPFAMFCARLPSSIFSDIIDDLQLFSWQYGTLRMHVNEEARARFLSGYFNRIVALFSGLVLNTPEEMLQGKWATKGRIEYQFRTYGGITVVFIEVKLNIGGLGELLNCYAQVIAECDACASQNSEDQYQTPIMAILCDGNFFYFFKFDDGRQTQFSVGQFPDGTLQQRIAEPDPSNPQEFLRQTRFLCESLYFVFLSGYQAGLEAYWNRSVEKSKNALRESTPKWHNAKVSARRALDEAKSAWNLRQENKFEESEESANRALQFLVTSVEEAPHRPPGFVDKLTDELKRFT